MIVRPLISFDDYSQMHDIIYSYDKIADRPIDIYRSKDEFYEKCCFELITFGVFVDNQLVSFLSSKLLTEIPSWFIFLLSAKKSNFFSIEKANILPLMDATIEYWESRGINSFVFVQSARHRPFINGINMLSSERVQKYTNPAPTIEIIKSGEKSKFSLINYLMRDYIYPNDMVVKWSFRLDLFKDYE